MTARGMYVVVEWDRVSGLPSVSTYSGFGGDIYDSREEAEEFQLYTRAERAERTSVGQPQRYAVARLELVSGGDT